MIRNIALLSIPFWGVFLFIYIGAALEHAVGGPSGTSGGRAIVNIFALLAPILVLASAAPIYLSKRLPTPMKFILVPIYYVVAAPIMFFVGWSALCVYKGSCA